MSCRTNCNKILTIFTLLATAIVATPAFAGDPCVQTAFGSHVTCTANDVRIAKALNPRHLDGTPFDSTHGCTAGQDFSFVADFLVVSTATQRENIGLYFQTRGSGNAVTGAAGTCSDNIISPPHHVSGDLVCLGSGTGGGNTCPTNGGTYEELDTTNKNASLNEPYDITGGTTGCGDISTADNNQLITVEVDNAKCVAGANGMLLLPNATSWQQQGGTLYCTGTGSAYSWEDTKTAIPGSPSKCNEDDTFTVPIIVQTPTTSVTKACSLDGGTTYSTTSCDFGATSEGGTVTYKITVSNSSNTGTITVDDICDTYYGTIAVANGYTAQACWGAGSPAGTPDSNSSTCVLPHTLQPQGQTGDNYSCTFTATQGENKTVSDTAYAYGVGADNTTPFNGSSSQVTVTSHDLPGAANIAKTAQTTRYACARVRYAVDISCTQDCPLTISKLTDDGYDLTLINTDTGNSASPVTGTTCGVDTAKGTVVTDGNLPGSGAFSSGGVGGTGAHYICYFDAQFCGNVGSITDINNYSCTTGIQHKDTVHGAFTGDEGESVPSTDGTVTANECIVLTGQ